MKAGKFLWNEFMRLLMPDGQLAFMADVWKVMPSTCGAWRPTEGMAAVARGFIVLI